MYKRIIWYYFFVFWILLFLAWSWYYYFSEKYFTLNKINLEIQNNWKEKFKIFLWWKKIDWKNKYIIYTWNNFFLKKYFSDIENKIKLDKIFQRNDNIQKWYLNVCIYKTNFYWWKDVKEQYWITEKEWKQLNLSKKLDILWKISIKNWEAIDYIDKKNNTWLNIILKRSWISKEYIKNNCDYIILLYWDFSKYFWMQESTFFHEFWHIIQFYLYNNNQYYKEEIYPKLKQLYIKSVKAYNKSLENQNKKYLEYVVREYSLEWIGEDWATLFENLINKKKFIYLYNTKNKIYKEKINILKNYINITF